MKKQHGKQRQIRRKKVKEPRSQTRGNIIETWSIRQTAGSDDWRGRRSLLGMLENIESRPDPLLSDDGSWLNARLEANPDYQAVFNEFCNSFKHPDFDRFGAWLRSRPADAAAAALLAEAAAEAERRIAEDAAELAAEEAESAGRADAG
ncbi:MAG TPA: hypothetical protein VGR63_15325 [Casimicrobiaceae bacterium]|nr:hypothetical protein [Casimicrobiaceae bacterium]